MLEVAKSIYCGFLGVYFLAVLIFGYCFYKLRIKESLGYFTFSLLIFSDMALTTIILLGLPEELKAYHIFPFAGFIWVFEYFVYYRLMENVFLFEGTAYTAIKSLLKVVILLLGCMAFFFGIEDFRSQFIIIFAEGNSSPYLGFTLTPLGLIVALVSTCACLAAAVHVFVEVIKAKISGIKALLLWSAGACVVLTFFDSMSLLGMVEVAPLGFLGFGPALFYFLFICFARVQGQEPPSSGAKAKTSDYSGVGS